MVLDYEHCCRLVRVMCDDQGVTLDQALGNLTLMGVADETVTAVQETLRRESKIITDPAIVIQDQNNPLEPWLHNEDRKNWKYWKYFRNYQLDQNGWAGASVRSLDDSTDKILNFMRPPSEEAFNTYGLVLGYVQSGKTANYSGLIAKAADTGYRLIIVMTGIHNSLRRQTQQRIHREILGSFPEWHILTGPEEDGDFDLGSVRTNILEQATQDGSPVIIIMKKWHSILAKVIRWLDRAPQGIREQIPVLIIDDEADQASINTGGNRPPAGDVEDEEDNSDQPPEDEIAPSRTNALIREIIQKFRKVAYVAYTATPYANVFINHLGMDHESGRDLYPKDFIVSLPKPAGYFGIEEIFGLNEDDGDIILDELPLVSIIPEDDVAVLLPANRRGDPHQEPELPESLKYALKTFILSGATTELMGRENKPATMLIHISHKTSVQADIFGLVRDYFSTIRDDLRYDTRHLLLNELEDIYNRDLLPTSEACGMENRPSFSDISSFILPFIEKVEFKCLNSASDDILDYEQEPRLKAIVIGGNKLSRGLTLEGLLVSYFVRPSSNYLYDSLTQMGRWCGFRQGYYHLTRIFTTAVLQEYFRDLAGIETDIRQHIRRYEIEKKTPSELGVLVRTHYAMNPTSASKMRYVNITNDIFSCKNPDTITFPVTISQWMENNIQATRALVEKIGAPTEYYRDNNSFPIWKNVPSAEVLAFLDSYSTDPGAIRVTSERLSRYIRTLNRENELIEWTVAVPGGLTENPVLGTLNLGSYQINCISRTRLESTPESLKRIGDPKHEEIDLTPEEMERRRLLIENENVQKAFATRMARTPERGLLLIYPISRSSGQEETLRRGRTPLFREPADGIDIIGLSFSFPRSPVAESTGFTHYVGSVRDAE